MTVSRSTPSPEWLKRIQNPDGGWGYRAGKQSCLEPTIYCLLALNSWHAAEAAMRQGLRYIRSLQRPDGSWQAAAHVTESHWAASLCLNLALQRREFDDRFRRGLQWLLREGGSEGSFTVRLGHWLNPSAVEFDATLRGWPWSSGTSSWVEPTCHALMLIAKLRSFQDSPELIRRLDDGRRLLLDRQCRDGGWNYGNPRVLGYHLPSYPDTTALALLALQSCGEKDLRIPVARARGLWDDKASSRLSRAWLALALAGTDTPVMLSAQGEEPNVITMALENIAFSKVGGS